MSLKKWIRETGKGAAEKGKESRSVDDLVSLGRLDEAAARLEDKLRRRPTDTHARHKLAEVLSRLGRKRDAIDQYLRVTDLFERDGFYRKASALAAKAASLAAGDERVQAKQRRLERIVQLDYLREIVVDTLPGSSRLKVERLWSDIAQADLLTRLSPDQFRRLLPVLDLRVLRVEEEHASAGERKDELTWIVTGSISARVLLRSGNQTEIRSFGPGDLIGERALFERRPWPAIYVAAEKTTVFALDRTALGECLVGEDDPRAFLEALRAEANDSAVLEQVRRMGQSTEGA